MKFSCPKTGEECFMAQWTGDHIMNQFQMPKEKRQSLCEFVIERVMTCDGDIDTCAPAEPFYIDLAVEEFKYKLENEEG